MRPVAAPALLSPSALATPTRAQIDARLVRHANVSETDIPVRDDPNILIQGRDPQGEDG